MAALVGTRTTLVAGAPASRAHASPALARPAIAAACSFSSSSSRSSSTQRRRRDAIAAPPSATAPRPGGGGGGAGVLDAPTAAPTRDPAQKGANKKPPLYKVMLHNDNYNRREYVVRVLLKVVEEVKDAEDAARVMQEAHESGVALVVATAQDRAEEYVEGLRLNGLVSTMEPGH